MNLLLVGLGALVVAGATIGLARLLQDAGPVAPLPGGVPPVGGSGIPASAEEVEALARVVASEAGGGSLAEQRAIAWAVRNRFRDRSVYAVEYPWRAQRGSDPPFSSARAASDAHRALAREVLLADQSEDPTGGATSFFEPRMQDVFFKAGELARAGETGDRVIDGVKLTDITRFKNYRKDAAGIRAKWEPGSTHYATAGRFEMWGSARVFAARGGSVRTIAGAGEEADPIERWAVLGEEEIEDAIDGAMRSMSR